MWIQGCPVSLHRRLDAHEKAVAQRDLLALQKGSPFRRPHIMFEKLIEMAIQGWAYIAPFAVIDAGEGGGVLRLGQYHRTLDTGFHWKWPFFERVVEVTTCITTTRLDAQTLTTQDLRGVVAAATIKYEIKNVKPFITEIFDQGDVLIDVTMGEIRKAVTAHNYADLMRSPPEDVILKAVREEVNKFGFKVHRITFTDLAAVRSLRLIQPRPKDMGN
jgi:regulator of protease activity HflC (stomatin/prohibitin superfamily)